MMIDFDEEQSSGEAVGLRNRNGESAAAAPKRMLIAENRILRDRLPARLRLTDPQRATLAEIGKTTRCRSLKQVATIAQPETCGPAEIG